MEATRSRRLVFFVFILSLLVHSILLLWLLNHDLEKHALPEVLLEEMPQKHEEWAATKAQASSFGAPVIFQELEPESIDDTDSDKKEIPVDQEDHIDKDQTKTEQATLVQKQEPKHDSNDQAKQQQKELMQKLAQKMRLSKQVSQAKEKQQQQAKPQPVIQEEEKKLTLAQLASGFLEQVKNEGNHRVTMLGKAGQVTEEQLKHERYVEKLSWCLQNSFKLNQERFPVAEPIKTAVEVLLVLNKNGSIHNLRLLKSTGNTRLDQFALFIFRDASSSFPPVPQYLPHDPYRIVYIVEINTTMDRNFGLYMSSS